MKSLKPWLYRWAVGAALGGVLGALGFIRAHGADPIHHPQLGAREGFLYGAAIGVATATMHYLTRSWRTGDIVGYRLSWMVSVATATVLVGIGGVIVLHTHDSLWLVLFLAVGLGALAGYGIAKSTENAFGPETHRH